MHLDFKQEFKESTLIIDTFLLTRGLYEGEKRRPKILIALLV